ncbi:MAG: ATP-binding protein [Patescibacteria group bacterium]
MSQAPPSIPHEPWAQIRDEVGVIRGIVDAYEAGGPTIEADQVNLFKERVHSSAEKIQHICLGVQMLASLVGHDLGRDIGDLESAMTTDVPRTILGCRQRLWVAERGIGSMRFFVEDEPIVPVSVSLGDFLRQILPYLEMVFKTAAQQKNQYLPKNGVVLELEGNPQVLMDHDSLATLLVNMARNAGIHGKANTLYIGDRYFPPLEPWEDGAEAPPDEVVVVKPVVDPGFFTMEIGDDGRGIPERINIYDIFKFGCSYGHGSGIGLGMANERLEKMGGFIDSSHNGPYPRTGANFRITLRTDDTL